MTASTLQAKGRRERRIIDRPRLIKLLDECEARIILLLAPAGYGKTTLARQWAKTLTRSIWITCTPAHRDVAVLAEDLASGIDSIEGDATTLVRQFLAAHANPQRVSRRIASALATQLEQSRSQWLVIDDYHELAGSVEAEEFIELLQQNTRTRLVIASRQRPIWARSRRIVYGEIEEIGREILAMTNEESTELLGRRSESLARQAEGWPAVLALAAAVEHPSPPSGALPNALHQFFAEELFQRAPPDLQEELLRFALLPDLKSEAVTKGEHETSPDLHDSVRRAAELGFVSLDDEADLHPLLRDFLLNKLGERADSLERVREAIGYCVEIEAWDSALRLITRFRCEDFVEAVLRDAFKPLALSGRLETLSSFAAAFRIAPAFPPPSVDVVEAESALREGHLELAADIASRVRLRLEDGHPLSSRAAAIEGHSNFQLARFANAEKAFSDARRTAQDDRDDNEALHGLALARIFGERADFDAPVAELWERRHVSPTHLLRAATAELSRRRLAEGLADPLYLDEAWHACPQVDDPRARSAFTYAAAYALAQKSQYRLASEWANRFWTDVHEYDLEFARPHAVWTTALIRLGLRRFGEAERLLQSLEDGAAERSDVVRAFTARILRARLLLQTGNHADAAALMAEQGPAEVYPSWRGEYLATRAMTLATIGDLADARRTAEEAQQTSGMAEVQMLAAAAHAMIDARQSDFDSAAKLLQRGIRLGVWDPVVCALRTCAPLADGLAEEECWRNVLEELYVWSNDLGLARRAGFRTRSNRAPSELLTPRELEVLGLIARGMRNSDIARALFISQSTAKVHVRHVLEKLGVRTRAEAVSRLEMFS